MAILCSFWGLVPWSDFPSVHSTGFIIKTPKIAGSSPCQFSKSVKNDQKKCLKVGADLEGVVGEGGGGVAGRGLHLHHPRTPLGGGGEGGEGGPPLPPWPGMGGLGPLS